MHDFNDVWYTSRDGIELYARDYRSSRNADKEATAIVCLPGMTRNSADFHTLALHLRARFRVIAVDLRGRGRSGHDPDSSNYNPVTYVADVNGLIEHLHLTRVIFIGTSLGGLVAMLIAASRPDYVQALILNDLAPEIEQAGLRRIQSYVGKAAPVQNWGEACAQARLFNGTELPDLTDEQWLAFARNIYHQEGDGPPVLAYDPAIAEPFNSREGNTALASLWPVYDALPQIPLLLIRGEFSDIVARESVQEMQRRRNILQYAEIPNRGHAPLLNEPEALRAIDQLLQVFSPADAESVGEATGSL